MHWSSLIAISCLLIFFDCRPTNTGKNDSGPTYDGTAVQCTSLLGKPLYPMQDSPSARHRKDSLLHIALADFREDPTDLQNIIWYGRRLAYLSQYQKSIDVYSAGLKHHPDSPELYRHRGHRFISTRQFERAISDLRSAARLASGRAVQIEPDGIPNRLNIPLSSLQFNIYYHLALAYYLRGNYGEAESAYLSCMKYSTNHDLLCATSDWYYMTLRRLGKENPADALLDRISAEMEIIENYSYHQRLMMYKGEIQPEVLLDFDNITPETELDVVTQGYGVANYFMTQGDSARGNQILERILETGYWAAFGYIAAEADLARRK